MSNGKESPLRAAHQVPGPGLRRHRHQPDLHPHRHLSPPGADPGQHHRRPLPDRLDPDHPGHRRIRLAGHDARQKGRRRHHRPAGDPGAAAQVRPQARPSSPSSPLSASRCSSVTGSSPRRSDPLRGGGSAAHSRLRKQSRRSVHPDCRRRSPSPSSPCRKRGPSKIAGVFGPVMLLWFLALAVSGIAVIIQVPGVLAALSPWPGLSFLLHHGLAGFFILSEVILCATGGEALYADMGHLGRKLDPARLVFRLRRPAPQLPGPGRLSRAESRRQERPLRDDPASGSHPLRPVSPAQHLRDDHRLPGA